MISVIKVLVVSSKVSSALGLGQRKHIFTFTYNNHFSLTLSIIVILQPCSKSHTSVSIAQGGTFQCSALILWVVRLQPVANRR